jgi:ribose 5-phosphate isomerase A
MALSTAERLERIGAAAAALVENATLVGLGTGSTAAAMVDALGERVQDGLSITAVATSNATRDQALALGIPVVRLDEIDRLDICIDGADEIDPALNLTKGGGGALLFEKLVARRANRYVIISSDEKLVDHLGDRFKLPVEVVPVGWVHTKASVEHLGLYPEIRMDGSEPYLTDSGHFILDCTWPHEKPDPAHLATSLKAITGVVEHGLFIGMADEVMTIGPDGEIETRTR